jgi:hypothetical protein
MILKFYIPHLLKVKSEKDFIRFGAWWQKVYNLVRPLIQKVFRIILTITRQNSSGTWVENIAHSLDKGRVLITYRP